ncbi:hypothetical protein QP027_06515 [Corynebacterium breve]|uniref:Uncharacterized protein n=1 Tax=Corynebacterium breve TaxID=3049799 RepID=A0ABY8VAV7_9CORY|nr:hypothetical protein [Corynebacterium breve]WIM66789.1 hypothetical protein QP027_06515 [Corynebacterium breve]
MSSDLKSIGLMYDKWQDAVEAAIATNHLAVVGEVRGGQLIQFNDGSGAQINILAVEPFATYAGFDSTTRTYAHVTMLNDVVAYCDIIDPHGNVITSVTVNLAQGPLIADEPTQQWQEMGVTALAIDVQRYESVDAYLQATGGVLGMILSEGAQAVSAGSGSIVPDASASFSARVLEAEYRNNQLTGQRFIHVSVDGAFPFDVCLPDGDLPERDSVVAGTALLTGALIAPAGCGGGGCGGSCGCGS